MAPAGRGVELVELADGVFAWIHPVEDRFTCNVGVIVGDDGLTLVDSSGIPSSYRALADALGRFGRPVERIVLTHSHGDHVAGASSFPGADVLASAACADELASPPPVEAFQALHPQVADELAGLVHPRPTTRVLGPTASLGRLTLELWGGHTAGDLVVRVDDADVMFTGDLCFFGHVPLGIGADVARWAESLEHLQSGHPRRVVPGHGPIGGLRDLAIVRDYLGAVLDAAAGPPGGSVAAGPWSQWWDPWADRIPNAVDLINVEQTRDPHGFPATLIALATS